MFKLIIVKMYNNIRILFGPEPSPNTTTPTPSPTNIEPSPNTTAPTPSPTNIEPSSSSEDFAPSSGTMFPNRSSISSHSPSSNVLPIDNIVTPSPFTPDIRIPDSIYLAVLIIVVFIFGVFLKKTLWKKKKSTVYSALDEDTNMLNDQDKENDSIDGELDGDIEMT